ncbi:MAG: helicase-exonuclease AddAB subunit AddA [Acetobacter sp.]|nr:helicase-exonuclease AddAB subunit AddA [Bacteroides sp.]MCM1340572.1 helicase-exonuclease AddAB subunit AddA [Acetobacter sp.]MCM1433312.1 helicase-exonuclease AddAB subunit AddA [Clostridiales bacterium]
MKTKWTAQQQNAINARNRNILVSAAAGSGKTAVLVERVKELVTNKENPVELDRLLIVTFTNAAAAEMKSRISKVLNKCINENPNDNFYKKQLSLLSSAKICTIDSFCTNLVKEHFYDLSISQDFSTLEDSELQLLEDTVISETIDDFFKNGNENFIKLIEAYTTPNSDKTLIEIVKKILTFIYAQPFPYKWLENALERYNPNKSFNESEWYSYLSSEISYLLEYGLSLINENIKNILFEDDKLNDKFYMCFNDDLSIYQKYIRALNNSWNELVNIDKPKFSRIPYSKKADPEIYFTIKSNRDTYKSIIDDISAFLISDEEDYEYDMKILYRQLETLIKLVKEVDTRIADEKKERNAYSFADIEHFAIELLFKIDDQGNIVKSDLAKSMSDEYYEILVDEYQDTNEAQNLLFTYLSNGKNLFCVGDIKQSIYRFRLAMPHIFNKKKKEYASYNPDDSEICSKIILDKNFRSRKEICSYVNFVFSNTMSERTGEMDYDCDEYLNYGSTAYGDTSVASAQINIVTGAKGEETDKKEASAIAKLILDKVNSKELITDGDTVRPVKFGDFAILMRSLKSHINEYSKVLTDYGIPLICDNSTNLFENSEIRMILSLLRAIDNPTQDIPLLATLMSAIYGFTADDLAEIKINSKGKNLYKSLLLSDNEKAKNFLTDISELRKISITMSVAGFIRYIIEDKGIISYINAMGNAEQRYQNILKLISFANTFDSGINVGLTAFIRYIDKIISSGKSVDSAPLSSSYNDAVTIMTVHHSKGLEFPICILAGSARRYNTQDLSEKLLINNMYGIGMKVHDEENFCQYKTIPYICVKNKSANELISENLRVLYVAMTRAKEQFITFYSCDNAEKKLSNLAVTHFDNGRISPYTCSKISSDGDLLALCGMLHQGGTKLRELGACPIKPIAADFDLSVNIINDIEILSSKESFDFVDADKNIVEKIDKKLQFKYERKELEGFASKLTASSLDSADSGFEYLTSSKPAFMNKNGLTPAQRGTAMHTFMQFCDYNNSRCDLEREIERLRETGFLSYEQADSLDKEKLSTFFSSPFAKRIFDSDRIYRELKLSSFVSAKEIYSVEFDDKVLVQGIADCVFEENGELVLLDYKTDRVKNADELLDSYKKQIQFYKKAVSKALGKPVKDAVLYSFYLGKLCYYK